MATFRKFTKVLTIASNTVVVLLFLLACSNAYLSTGRWILISLLGLFFPLLLILVIGFLIFWLFLHSRRYALISFIALVLGWQNIHAFFAFDIHKRFVTEKPANALRILTWNVHGWDEFLTKKLGASGHRTKMFDFIKEQNADILCFQEFFEPRKMKGLSSNISYISEQMNYPYHYFSRDYRRWDNLYEFGAIIFSRFPITDSLRFKFPEPGPNQSAESLLAADISVNGKTIRVYTAHLQSVLFHGSDFRNVEIIKNVDDSVLEASKSLIKKLRTAYAKRRIQSDMVREQIDQSPHPLLICGDFNDVPNSYTYFHILGPRQDAFIKKGFGIGRTYVHLSPTLRIDYIMADQQFKVLQCSKFPLPYSDHHPVVADIQIPWLRTEKGKP
jgi:endonuclease/exonuclease/phosphatase family metal-dependent hydrolase